MSLLPSGKPRYLRGCGHPSTWERHDADKRRIRIRPDGQLYINTFVKEGDVNKMFPPDLETALKLLKEWDALEPERKKRQREQIAGYRKKRKLEHGPTTGRAKGGMEKVRQERIHICMFFPTEIGSFGVWHLRESPCGTLACLILNDHATPDVLICKREDVEKDSWILVQWKTGSRDAGMKGKPFHFQDTKGYKTMVILCTTEYDEETQLDDRQVWCMDGNKVEVDGLYLGHTHRILSHEENLCFSKGKGPKAVVNGLLAALAEPVRFPRTNALEASFLFTEAKFFKERWGIHIYQVLVLQKHGRFPIEPHGKYDYLIMTEPKAVRDQHKWALRFDRYVDGTRKLKPKSGVKGDGGDYENGDFDFLVDDFLDMSNRLFHVWRLPFANLLGKFSPICHFNPAKLPKTMAELGYTVPNTVGGVGKGRAAKLWTQSFHKCYHLTEECMPPLPFEEWPHDRSGALRYLYNEAKKHGWTAKRAGSETESISDADAALAAKLAEEERNGGAGSSGTVPDSPSYGV